MEPASQTDSNAEETEKPKRGLGGLSIIGLAIYIVFTFLGAGKPVCSPLNEVGCIVGGAFTRGLAWVAAFGLLLFAIDVYRRRKNINWTGGFAGFTLLVGVPLSLFVWMPAFGGDPEELLAIQIGLAMNIIFFAATLLLPDNWKNKRYVKLAIAAAGLAGLCYAFNLLETRPCPEKLAAGETASMCWSKTASGIPRWHSSLQAQDERMRDLMIDDVSEFR